MRDQLFHLQTGGIPIEPAEVHFLDAGTAPWSFFRLGFSSIATERIEPGLARLGETIREQLAGC